MDGSFHKYEEQASSENTRGPMPLEKSLFVANHFRLELWPRIGFGDYAHKSLGQAVFADPGWFYGAVESDLFSGLHALAADEVARRAQRIRTRDGSVVDHVRDYRHGFSHLEIVPPDSHRSGFRRPYFNLSLARPCNGFNSTETEMFIKDVKEHLFGSSSYRMTRGRCREFFSDASNFFD